MSDQLTEAPEAIRGGVRERYAAAARSVTGELPQAAACCGSDAGDPCCGAEAAVISDDRAEAFGSGLYDAGERDQLPDTALLASLGCGNPTAVAELHAGERDQLPDTALLASLGCGNPTAVAELHEGETVLDLGSGGGIDVLLSARLAGATGKAYGLDMTDEMLQLARANQAKAGITNVEWLKGHIEDIPHRVHAHAGSAIVRARKPDVTCCSARAQTECCEPAAKDACCGTAASASGGCGCG